MIPTEVTTVTIVRNAVAVVTAALLPVAMVGLPATCAPLLPDSPLLSLLYALSLL